MDATLDWFGCSTFRLTVGELVIFLDAYLDRVPGAQFAGLLPELVETGYSAAYPLFRGLRR